MLHTRIAKLFKNGSSQAVRLPAEFRFNTKEIYMTQDDHTGDIVLSSCSGANAWTAFFDLIQHIDVPENFMKDRPMNTIPSDKHLFNDE